VYILELAHGRNGFEEVMLGRRLLVVVLSSDCARVQLRGCEIVQANFLTKKACAAGALTYAFTVVWALILRAPVGCGGHHVVLRDTVDAFMHVLFGLTAVAFVDAQGQGYWKEPPSRTPVRAVARRVKLAACWDMILEGVTDCMQRTSSAAVVIVFCCWPVVLSHL
jgi:hypothetical protein